MKRALPILLFFTVTAYAKWLRVPFEGVRPLGMGNAFVALADDANLLWYNPAGLAYVKQKHASLIDLSLGFESQDTLKRMKDALVNDSYPNLLRPDTQYMSLGSRPSFLMPFFGFSIFNNLTSFSDIKNLSSLDATVDIAFKNDMGALVAFAIPFTKYFSVGVSAKIIHRISADMTLTGNDLLAEVQDSQDNFLNAIYSHVQKISKTGYALGANVGVLAELPLQAGMPRVRLAATIEDLGVTTFRPFGTLPTPDPIPQTYHAGISASFVPQKDWTLHLSFDARDCFQRIHWTKMAHLGAEIKHKFFGLRTGIYQGYPTAGFSLDFAPHTKFHAASVMTELGDGFHERGLRWYVFQFTVGFNPL